MNRHLISALALGLIAGVATAAEPLKTDMPKTAIAASTVASALASGIDVQTIDQSVRPQDDFFRYLNGKWLDATEIPADKSSWGSFYKLADDTQPQLRAIIEAAAQNPNNAASSEAQKIGDFYASFMDEKTVDELGLTPLDHELAKIRALKDKKELPSLIAHLQQIGVGAPYDFGVHQDARDSTKYVVDFAQSGLGMPDRDYYLKLDDAKLADARAKYLVHVEKMLTLAGDQNAAANARQIVALETELAKVQWTKVENRDPVKTYNKLDFAKLNALTPGYNWKSYLSASGIDGKVNYVIVSQPSYFTGFNKVLKNTSLATWKAYFEWHLVSAYAAALSKPFVDQNFAFYSTALRGVPENRPRWKRGVGLVQGSLGEVVGKLYVEKHFPAERKARMEALVQNLLAAYRQSIDTLDWMSPQTKQEAQTKLAKFTPKIGYPNKWRDYSSLQIVKGDLVGNMMRATQFANQYEINKLGKPIDRAEWGMTPQTVNAYYNPELNEIVFPAAILQPPFFDAKADDAVNYGAIGAVIGHEISHGFDDQGAQYDGDGNLRDWWSKDDHKNFAARTKMLVEQYNAFSPLPGYHVNGALTLGENIADNSGLAIAYKAYKLSLGGKDAPVIDGLTGEQRFYMGFAQVWRSKTRDQQVIVGIKSDPHSPDQFRTMGTLANQPGFYSAFDVKEGDKMYRAPNQRVIIW
ncbi:M13 family metallopeptidase [Undibacterium arcticum]|uniref:M13 family metallopeptidase n=1 Tax=Undibacterium arcticum TaxID=1762892 RepID=A0ABV7FBB7_9BURK